MILASGARLGAYEVQAPLGAGGMGEVYRARDTRLGRDVAIKILPEHLTEKPEARQRFEREARAISSLQHPNICTLYDVGHQDGTDFLVMEYLEGETLAKRLERGAIPTAELLRIGIEVSDALDKAHRKGILHRDLKPSNIMLTKSGAKLMDFGLAKAAGDGGAPALESLTQSIAPSARTTPVTAQGMIVGTFQYMSPEQMEGKEADARSDIFSLGAVLFEMATGKRAFEGKTTASVIAAILEREPPAISSVQPMSPPALDRTVKICLAKDPDERFQSAHDVKLQLEWIREAGSQAGVPAPVVAHRKHRERIAWSAAALLGIAFGLALAGYIARAPVPAHATVSQILPPPNTNFVLDGLHGGPPVLSPDGQRLAFAAVGSDGKQLLWVRALNAAAAQPLAGTDGAFFPFWSPDSRSLGFFANKKLNRIDASGGPTLALADAAAGHGGSWGVDGNIVFAPDAASPIYRVAASGGAPEAVTKLNGSRTETHRWPQFLPDGRHLLFYAHITETQQDDGTYVAPLDGGQAKLLVRGDSNAVYAAPGYLLFIRQGTLMAQQFDLKKLQLIGEAMPLAEHAETNSLMFHGALTVSENGILAYQVGTSTGGNQHVLWFDRSGKQVSETGAGAFFTTPTISPDGQRLAVAAEGSGPAGASGTNIWTFDLARGIQTRLTFSAAIDANPWWSSDGKDIIFQSTRGGRFNLYQKAANGTGSTSPLVVDNSSEIAPSLTSDERYLVFQRKVAKLGSHDEIWALPRFGDRKAFPVVQNPQFDVDQPDVSPDGKWLAYVSRESGRPEVYVVTFPHGGGRWQVSTAGGTWPRWRHDGKELFYLSPDNRIVSAEISEEGASLVIGKVVPLFQTNPGEGPGRKYDVSADGKKFVVASQGAQQASAPLTLVTNWPALLKKQP